MPAQRGSGNARLHKHIGYAFLFTISNILMIIVYFIALSKVESQPSTWEFNSQPTVSELTDECVVECDSLGEFVDEKARDSNSDFSEEVIS